ncbi:glyceraldehyde-3-phosphate dehydrogenase [Bacteroidota bacterium]
MLKKTYESELHLEKEKKQAAIQLIQAISSLWYEDTIELILFRNQLLNKNISEILNLLQYSSEFVLKPISIFDIVDLTKALQKIELPPSKIDIGKLVFEYKTNNSKISLTDFLKQTLHLAKPAKTMIPKDVVLYGFGRIGRLIARELSIKIGNGNQLRLRAIVVRGEITEEILKKRASLLMNDSIHKSFSGTVVPDISKKALIINGITVYIISANCPEEIDYTQYGIHNALIIDNTGAYRNKEALSRHLKSKGSEKVLLTAPGAEVPNVVYGVNQANLNLETTSIFSAASCTTNAITPILKIIEDNLGVINGHLETIHAYTNDQNLVDNMHKKNRRGRAAGLNMVITETGAGSAVTKAIPSFEGKLTSNAIRVPIPNGSLAILNLKIEKETTVEAVNNIVKEYALTGNLVEQIKYSLSDELVSSDILGTTAPAVFDSKATIVSNDKKNIVLYIWYDNEYGYSHQVIRLAKYISKVRRFTYY